MARQSLPAVKSAKLKGIAAGPKGGKGTADQAKREVLKLLEDGYKTAEAMTLVGRSPATYRTWRDSDPEFKEAASRIIGRHNRTKESEKREVPDFPEFCEVYLGWRLYRHHLQWIDILEGREPRDLHSSQIYEPARKTHVVINTPPSHAKSSVITVAYTLWHILKDTNSLVIIISKKQEMAAEFIKQIQDFLTNPTYEKLQSDFGPPEGFKRASTEWSGTRIRFGPTLRDKTAKDPTVQAVGIRGQIYGKRATLIIGDDTIDTENVQEVDKQFKWLTQMVASRIGHTGRLLMVGTRVAPVDLYRELRNPDRYGGQPSSWTYFAQPAVEDFGPTPDDPKTWRTLWPKSNQAQVGDDESVPDENGEVPMWDGPRLKALRGIIGENAWAQNYQQLDLQETAVFERDLVYGCVNGMRKIGPLKAGAPGHPADGMLGMRVVAGLDPASAGHTAAVVLAFDPQTKKRWLLDAHNQPGMTPQQKRTLMVDWTKRYGIREWRVEKVLLSQEITQDINLVRDLASLGATMHEHITNRVTKWDVDAGVMSLTALIQGATNDPKTNLLQLPSVQSEVIRMLCEQMVTYFPKTKGKTDLLMALWFAEARVRQMIQAADDFNFMDSPFLSRQDKEFQVVVDLNNLDPDEPVYFSPYATRRAS